ncbi:M20 metallopeptidase family protein (plasmid) [Pseudarthrobacter sp. P1]|uniref:M20 metallopeptidase family protein n=1 Tax=Pseudarthrobacter sp. P1 TaxID=3418418 RepID=UPI003CE93594
MKIEVDTDSVIAWRRHIHQNPELSFHETRTSDLVRATLEGFGLEVIQPAETSVIGILRGAFPGRTVALRADMDALPLDEETGLEFASKNPGIMHACGHDAHTAMLLGAAKALTEMRAQLSGVVKFIFQHAEEQPPGGAAELVSAGVLDDVDAIFGLHIMNQRSGTIVIPHGPASSAVDGTYITIQGRGSHGSMPQHGIDPVVVGAEIVLGLQTVVSRSIAPDHFAVATVGTFQAGEAPNVIPDTARLGVSLRTSESGDREYAKQRVEEIVSGICAAHRASSTLEWQEGYAAVINDEACAQLAFAAASKVLKPEDVGWGPATSASEDFSAYSNKIPGCFIFLGGGDESQGYPYQNHHPKFDIDESALQAGTKAEVQIALDYLSSGT